MLKSIRIFFILLLVIVTSASFDAPPPPPPGAIGPYLNGIFSETTPGAGGAWELEDPMPNLSIVAPLRIIPFPGSSDLLVLSKAGEIWRLSLEGQTQDLVLDIKDRAFKRGEAGTTGLVLHPRFGDPTAPDKQWAFVFYRYKPNPDEWDEIGFNRLAKFKWDSTTNSFDPDSEEILIQQYDRSTWHNGGGMFFGPDGMLYLALGDEGNDEYQAASTQKLTGGFFSGLLRIDIDNDPTLSHPILRQPQANANPPAGWGNSYSQGYSIPNDNPWLSSDGSILEEFFAIGVRSPFSTYYDALEDKIWVSDVGSDKREEISHIEKGDNLQWPFMEGSTVSEVHDKPEFVIGNEKPYYFEYEREQGTCIIGGNVYRGELFPELNGKYLFADYTADKLMALTNTGTNSEPEFETLLSSLGGQPVDLPVDPGITGIFALENGEILITVMAEETGVLGKIYRLKAKTYVPDPPALLSELAVFADMENLEIATGIVPYTVNAPLWSDRAVKQRWIAIPNDGTFDSPEERIKFKGKSEWTFPEGTVFIKHFELPLTENPAGETARLETRFFIIGKGGIGYGLTYRWNDEGTDAELMGGGTSRDFDIYEGGTFAFTQTWDYPSRDQCLSCHTDNAKYALGVNTHQLNGELYYPHLGTSMNQLEYFNEINAFDENIGEATNYNKSYYIKDESVDLGVRIRSYLDSNCSSCHRLGGVPTTSMDLRFVMPLELQNLVNLPTKSQASNPNQMIVEPGYHASSELWVRDASMDDGRMPPLSRNIVDEYYIDALAEWIDKLPEDAGSISEFLVYPNPSIGWLSMRMNDDWEGPFHIKIISMSGKIVYRETFESNSVYLDLTKLTKGVYIVEVSADEERQLKRIVLQ